MPNCSSQAEQTYTARLPGVSKVSEHHQNLTATVPLWPNDRIWPAFLAHGWLDRAWSKMAKTWFKNPAPSFLKAMHQNSMPLFRDRFIGWSGEIPSILPIPSSSSHKFFSIYSNIRKTIHIGNGWFFIPVTGGRITGLTWAYLLKQGGHNVVVLERFSRSEHLTVSLLFSLWFGARK